MTELIIGIVVVVIVSLGLAGSDRYASHRANKLIRGLDDWDDWDASQRAGAVRKMQVRLAEEQASLRRGLLVFALAVMAGGTWAILSVQDTSDKTESVVVELRESTCTYFRLQNSNVTEEIRQKQVRRDRAAQEIIDLQESFASETPLEDIPGFLALDPASREFVQALASDNQAEHDAAVGDAERRLGIYDEDLLRLRAQVDEIRALANDSSCPW